MSKWCNTRIWHFLLLENLCRRPTIVLTQSSTYDKHEADFANDGDVTTVKRFCASTDIKHSKAWLQADLGESFSIKSVKLYFANDGTMQFIKLSF